MRSTLMEGSTHSPVLEPEAYQILRRYGLSLPRYGFARTRGEAQTIASGIGFPVVAKVVSPWIMHKSDVGGVIMGLRVPEEVGRAFDELESVGRRQGVEIAGALIVSQAPPGQEVMVGAFRDTEFGPVVAVGMGGTLVELFRDLAYGLAPVDRAEALDMIRSTRAGKALQGTRGRRACDLDPVADALVAVSNLIAQNPEIQEIDLNPVTVYADECLVLDARILVS